TQLGLLGAGARAGEFTVLAGTFWQNTMLTGTPLIDPAVRLRTLCHVTPGEWMLEGIGFYCGMAMRWYRDAFCDAEAAAARGRGVDPYVVMEENAARIPPGSNGVYAILSNLMNARRWVHASPAFLQFNLSDPAGTGRAACVRAIEEAAAYVVRGHLGIIAELTGQPVTELTFSGGAAKGALWPQIIADVVGLPVHVPAGAGGRALGAAPGGGHGGGGYSTLPPPYRAPLPGPPPLPPPPRAASGGGGGPGRGCPAPRGRAAPPGAGGLRAYRGGPRPPQPPPPAPRRKKEGARAGNDSRGDGARFLPSVPVRFEPYPLKGA